METLLILSLITSVSINIVLGYKLYQIIKLNQGDPDLHKELVNERDSLILKCEIEELRHTHAMKRKHVNAMKKFESKDRSDD